MEFRYAFLRLINLGLTMLGMLVFGGLLAGLLLFQAQWEIRARDYLVAEVTETASAAREMALRLAGEQTALPASTLATATAALAAAHRQLIEKIATDGCLLSCEQTILLRQVLVRQLQLDQIKAELVIASLRKWSNDAYRERRDKLYRDILIVLGSNFTVMVLAFGLALWRKRAAPHLLPISALLTLTTSLASLWYLFGQNWLATLFYSSFFGWAYLALLLVIFLLLADIALNRGRFITRVVNWCCESVFEAAPLNLC